MNYEQKYKDALDAAKHIYDDMKSGGNFGGMEDLEVIFPELAESEDERIRKFLKDYAIEMIAGLESDISISVYDGVKGHDPDAEEELEKWRGARAWLEKQKEQKVDIDKLRRDIYQSGYNDGYQHGKEDAQKEQRLAEWSEEDIKKIRSEEYTKGFNDAAFGGKLKEWSVEDEDRIRQIELIARDAGCTQKLQEEIHDWLKSLRPKCVNVSDQTLQLLICYLYGCYNVAKRDGEKADCRRYISYLEDLDYTLKNRWKPSEEQMEALDKVVNGDVLLTTQYKSLESLYEQLKAL